MQPRNQLLEEREAFEIALGEVCKSFFPDKITMDLFEGLASFIGVLMAVAEASGFSLKDMIDLVFSTIAESHNNAADALNDMEDD